MNHCLLAKRSCLLAKRRRNVTSSYDSEDISSTVLEVVFSFLDPLPNLFVAKTVCRAWHAAGSKHCTIAVGPTRKNQCLHDAMTFARPGMTLNLDPCEYLIPPSLISCTLRIRGQNGTTVKHKTPQKNALIEVRASGTNVPLVVLDGLSLHTASSLPLLVRCGCVRLTGCNVQGRSYSEAERKSAAPPNVPTVGLGYGQFGCVVLAQGLLVMDRCSVQGGSEGICIIHGVAQITHCEIENALTGVCMHGEGVTGGEVVSSLFMRDCSISDNSIAYMQIAFGDVLLQQNDFTNNCCNFHLADHLQTPFLVDNRLDVPVGRSSLNLSSQNVQSTGWGRLYGNMVQMPKHNLPAASDGGNGSDGNDDSANSTDESTGKPEGSDENDSTDESTVSGAVLPTLFAK